MANELAFVGCFMERRLSDLNPEWTHSVHSPDFFGAHSLTKIDGVAQRRRGTAIWCECPCGCDSSLVIPLANPLDGGPADPRGAWGAINFRWVRQGDDFDSLSLSPSVHVINHWHGWITQGLVVPC